MLKDFLFQEKLASPVSIFILYGAVVTQYSYVALDDLLHNMLKAFCLQGKLTFRVSIFILYGAVATQYSYTPVVS
jgi:hypothetical protein